jgi:probable DNA repair protein
MGDIRKTPTDNAPGDRIGVDAWLAQGGWVVAASDRAARALVAAFDDARQKEGLTAWPSPQVLEWKSFVRAEILARSKSGRLLLNPLQEQAIWAEIAKDGRLATLLEGPRHRLAQLAMEAHELLCSYAPRYLYESARSTWQQDAAAFSGWLGAFDKVCRKENLLSPGRLALELIPLLEADSTSGPPLLLVGFDRLLPVQRTLFDAWGHWEPFNPSVETTPGTDPALGVHFYAAPDTGSELAACARWCANRLAADPHARLMVIVQNTSRRRGQIERAFLHFLGDSDQFEFSLGAPLSQVAVARGAHMLLRWLSGQSLAEQELDWLFSSGQTAATAEESEALQAYLRALRRHQLERPQWTLQAFLSQPHVGERLPAAWTQRIVEVRDRLEAFGRRAQSPLDTAELVPQLLQISGWPGHRPLSSAEFQAARRWQQAVESTASLGFDGRRIDFRNYLSALARALDETLFAPESRHAPILIAGPAESAGLTADAIWFLGADENSLPAAGSMHPLLPPEIQREAQMPHSSPQLDCDLAQAITLRLLASVSEVHFSYARQTDDAEARPSRLAVHVAGAPQPLPADLAAAMQTPPLTESFEDFSRIQFRAGRAEGGSSVLTAQSQCPFKAFATARLDARGWTPAAAALTASQRGQLMHAVLHAIWEGPPHGILTYADLEKKTDLRSFVECHIGRAFAAELPSGLRERLSPRYLELEEERLTRLITEWLTYEATRIPFEVAGTEVDNTIVLGDLTLRVRIDRIDRLNDGTLLVIDYKSGMVTPKSWELPRPEDVQLPLYAGFALDSGCTVEGEAGGLVFATLRAGKCAFEGHVGNAKASLFSFLNGTSSLVKRPLTAEQLIDWRDHIQQLARDFVDGKAEVDPRDETKTCEYCGLEALCRIQEARAAQGLVEDGEESTEGDQEADNE